jgi:hypothetical protein
MIMPLQWVFEFWFHLFLLLVAISAFIGFLVLFCLFLYWVVAFPIRLLYHLVFCHQTLREAVRAIRSSNAIENLMHTDFSQSN